MSDNLAIRFVRKAWTLEAWHDAERGAVVSVTDAHSARTVETWRSPNNCTAEAVSSLRDWTTIPYCVRRMAWGMLRKWEKKLAKAA